MTPAYLPELAQLIAAGVIPAVPGRLTHVTVAHDPECQLLAGSGAACNCSPEIHPGRPITPDRCP